VQLENAQENEYTLKVTDATGRELSTQEIKNNTTNVNLSNYDSGVYFIQISKEKTQSIHKVIKK